MTKVKIFKNIQIPENHVSMISFIIIQTKCHFLLMYLILLSVNNRSIKMIEEESHFPKHKKPPQSGG